MEDDKPVSTKKYKRRAAETVQLLSRNARFNDLVRKARTELGIPPRGFTSEDEVWKWRNDLSVKDSEYVQKNYPEYEKIADDNAGKKDVQSKAKVVEARLNYLHNAPADKFRAAVANILRTAKLDNEWFYAVENYILRGNSFGNLANFVTGGDAVNVTSQTDDYTKATRIVLKFGTSTTLEEISEAWHQVEALQNRLGKPRKDSREKKNFERDLMVYDLANEGVKHREIADTITNNFDTPITYKDVPQIHKRMKAMVDGVI